MEAELDGPQRKVLSSRVRPLRLGHGDSGIRVQKGKTLPFVISRHWSAPAGHYTETWYLVHPETREVLYEGPSKEVLVWGLQSATKLQDEVAEPFALTPGTYLVVFSLGGLMGGQLEVEATEVESEAA